MKLNSMVRTNPALTIIYQDESNMILQKVGSIEAEALHFLIPQVAALPGVG